MSGFKSVSAAKRVSHDNNPQNKTKKATLLPGAGAGALSGQCWGLCAACLFRCIHLGGNKRHIYAT